MWFLFTFKHWKLKKSTKNNKFYPKHSQNDINPKINNTEEISANGRFIYIKKTSRFNKREYCEYRRVLNEGLLAAVMHPFKRLCKKRRPLRHWFSAFDRGKWKFETGVLSIRTGLKWEIPTFQSSKRHKQEFSNEIFRGELKQRANQYKNKENERIDHEFEAKTSCWN